MPTVFKPPALADVPSYFDFGYLPPPGTFFALGQRIYVVKAVVNPNDSSVAVNIPVLVFIRINYPGEFNQNRNWSFDPYDPDDLRVTRVQRVYNTGNLDIGLDNNDADPTQYVDVERISRISTFDLVESAQRILPSFDNLTGEGDQDTPAHFSHLATRLARWYQSDGAGTILDTNVFLDIEYIDRMLISQNDVGINDVSTIASHRHVGILGQKYTYSFLPHWQNQFNDDGTFSTASNPQPIAA